MQTENLTGHAPLAAHTPSFLAQLPSQPRLLLLLSLLLLQALSVALLVHPRSAQHGGALAFLPQLGLAIKYAIYFFTALLLALTARLPALWRSLVATHAGQTRPMLTLFPILQLLGFGLLWFVISALIPNGVAHLTLPVASHEAAWLLLLAAAIAAVTVFSLLSLAPATWWRSFVREEKLAFLLAALFTVGIYYITGIFANTWDDYLSIPTIGVSKFLLELFYSGVHADTVSKEMGIGNFVVLISSTCSGYEGMGMIAAFLAWYSLTFRQDLKYPNALLLFPVAIFSMWIFNCIRIAALIAIGYSYSPEIAIQGFHSNAGWIYFLCISVGLVLAARRIPFFSGKPAGILIQIDAQNVLVLPELVLLTTTLLTAALSAGFEWLYPLRVLATGLVLVWFWKRFDLGRFSLHATPVGIGVLVFLFWLAMVPPAPDASRLFGEQLAAAPAAGALAWLAIRTLGTALVVPLAEELAFRGYLINLLSRPAATGTAAHKYHGLALLPLLVSSLCFGALHSQWIAGTVAGIAFGLARYRRGKVLDAVLAHAVTNGLLAAYVLLSGQWSYW